MRALGVIWLFVLFAGCGVIRDAENKATMDGWMGQPVSSYALQNGPPLAAYDLGPGTKAFQWQMTGETAGVAMPIGRNVIYRPPQQTSCIVAFTATARTANPTLADWIITGWQYSGSC